MPYERVAVDRVVRGIGGDGHRTRKVDAGPQHRRQDAADPLEDGGLGQVAHDGKLQHELVEDPSAARRASHGDEARDNGDQHREDDVPPRAMKKLEDVEQHSGRRAAVWRAGT